MASRHKVLEEKEEEDGDKEEDDDEDYFVKERPKQSTYERRNIVRAKAPGSAYAPYTPPGEEGVDGRTKSGRLGYSQVSMGRRGVASYRGESGEAPVRSSMKLKEGFASAIAEAERFAGELGSKFQRSLNRRSNKSMGEKSVEDVDFVPIEVRERKRWWPFGGSKNKPKQYVHESDQDIDIEVEGTLSPTKAKNKPSNARQTRSRPPPEATVKKKAKEEGGFPVILGSGGLFAGAAALFQGNSPPEKPPKPVYILSRTTVDPPVKPKRPAKIIARDMEDLTQPLSLLKWSIAARNLAVIGGVLYLYVVPFAFLWDFSVNQGQRPQNERELLLVDISIPYIAAGLGVGILLWEQWSGACCVPGEVDRVGGSVYDSVHAGVLLQRRVVTRVDLLDGGCGALDLAGPTGTRDDPVESDAVLLAERAAEDVLMREHPKHEELRRADHCVVRNDQRRAVDLVVPRVVLRGVPSLCGVQRRGSQLCHLLGDHRQGLRHDAQLQLRFALPPALPRGPCTALQGLRFPRLQCQAVPPTAV